MKINKRKGFSMVELIIVIAILAVLIAVLAPALLSYTERSRAQKDFSSMDEVSNALVLGLNNSDAYDEASGYSTLNNVSCYVDNSDEAKYDKIIIKASSNGGSSQYTFGDDSRLLDETQYYAAGNMRGLTITFEPVRVFGNETQYVLKDAVINKFEGKTAKLGDTEYLYNIVRQSIGNDVIQTSQTYRNSEYTIFIRLGTTGGNDTSKQDAVVAYGQYSGTNLPETDPTSYDTTINRSDADNEDNEFNNPDTPSNGNTGTPEFDGSDLGGGGSFTPGDDEDDVVVDIYEDLKKQEGANLQFGRAYINTDIGMALLPFADGGVLVGNPSWGYVWADFMPAGTLTYEGSNIIFDGFTIATCNEDGT